MGSSSLYFFRYHYLVIAMYFYLILTGNAIESPQYTVMHSESDFEIRLYLESSWMSALVLGATSFDKSTNDGFHRLYQYLKGGNLDHSRITMTAPVLTSINSSSSSSSSSSPSSRSSDYFVRYYVPTKYVGNPPKPNPELNLQFDKWRSHCIAVRKFTGFAKDDNTKKESEALVNSLNKYLTGINGAVLVDKSSYSVAQYNASRHLSGRLNEVWIDGSGFAAEGCPRYQGK